MFAVQASRISPLLFACALVEAGCIPKERSIDDREGLVTVPGKTESASTPGSSTSRTDGAPNRPAPKAPTPSSDPLLATRLSDNFNRKEVGSLWRTRSMGWRLDSDQLCGAGARNQPIWLTRRIPENARIEFDAFSRSADGDIKVETWGDGLSGAAGLTYDDATSYLMIFGGWKNRFHVLARLDEHATDRIQLRTEPGSEDPRFRPVVPHESYHFAIERADGHTVRWLVNGIELAVLEDSTPLTGPGHDHFGFNVWEAPVCFDNLTITPL